MRTEEKVLGVLMALTCLFGRAFYQYNSTVVLVTGFVQMVKTAVMLAGMLLFFPHFVKAVRQYVPSHFRFHGKSSCLGVLVLKVFISFRRGF